MQTEEGYQQMRIGESYWNQLAAVFKALRRIHARWAPRRFSVSVWGRPFAGNDCLGRARRPKYMYFLLCLISTATPSQASAEEPRAGAALDKKFTLEFAPSEMEHSCRRLLGRLNQPAIYDPNNLARSLLAMDRKYLWMNRSVRGEQWEFPETLGDTFRQEGLNLLQLDLDGDGSKNSIVRVWSVAKGQHYNQIFDVTSDITDTTVDISTIPELLSAHSLAQILAQSAPSVQIDSSYFLYELIKQGSKSYVLALSAVAPGVKSEDRRAFAVEFQPGMSPALACVLKTQLQFSGPSFPPKEGSNDFKSAE
jgi:hypothetical protein